MRQRRWRQWNRHEGWDEGRFIRVGNDEHQQQWQQQSVPSSDTPPITKTSQEVRRIHWGTAHGIQVSAFLQSKTNLEHENNFSWRIWPFVPATCGDIKFFIDLVVRPVLCHRRRQSPRKLGKRAPFPPRSRPWSRRSRAALLVRPRCRDRACPC